MGGSASGSTKFRWYRWAGPVGSALWVLVLLCLFAGGGYGFANLRNHYILADLDAKSRFLTEVTHYRVLDKAGVRRLAEDWANRNGGRLLSIDVTIAPLHRKQISEVERARRAEERAQMKIVGAILPELESALREAGAFDPKGHAVQLAIALDLESETLGLVERRTIEASTIFESTDKAYVPTHAAVDGPQLEKAEVVVAGASPSAAAKPAPRKSRSVPGHVRALLEAFDRQRAAETALARSLGGESLAEVAEGPGRRRFRRLVGKREVRRGPSSAAAELVVWIELEPEKVGEWLGRDGVDLLIAYRRLLVELQGLVDQAADGKASVAKRVPAYLESRLEVMPQLWKRLSAARVYTPSF